MSASQSTPKRRAIIHIGAPKTGTTSIQEYLAMNRDEMQKLGFAYPCAPGKRTHMILATAIAQAARTGSMTSLDLLQKNLAAEIAALPETVHTVIFSSEHLSLKIASDEDARRLRQFLDSWFESYRIVLYMRRQDERAVSNYSTQLRAGHNVESVLPNNKFRRNDYLPILERYGAAFGQDALAPRLFVRDAFKDGDLLTDFREVAGLPELPNMLPKALNPSFSATAQEIMRRLNAIRGGDEEHDKVPVRVREILRRYSGPGRRPSRKEAIEYYEAFSDSNEKIRATWFPDRATLFPEDFSRYPEEGDPLPTDTELLEVALTVITEQASGEWSAKSLLRRADDAAKNGSRREARRFVERLLDTAPGNLDALTRLVDLVDGPRSRRAAAARVSKAHEADPQSEAISALFARLGSRSGEEGRTEEELAERRARRLRRHREEVRGKKSEGGEASARSALRLKKAERGGRRAAGPKPGSEANSKREAREQRRASREQRRASEAAS